MSDRVERAHGLAARAEPRWTPEREVAVEHAMARRARRRTTTRRLLGSATAALLLVTAVWIGRPRPGPPGEVRFADGSRATPTQADAALAMRAAAEGAIASEILRGGYRFTVVRDERRRFEVRAGRVQVEVLGTQFAVDRLETGEARVSVLSGHVRITWAGGQAELRDGQAGTFPPPERGESSEPRPAPAERDPRPGPGPVSALARPAEPRAGRAAWQQLARASDYEPAYAALKRTAVPPTSAAELILAADVARLSRHPEDAVALLEQLVVAHPRDPRAPLAAFTLGRVLLEDLGRPRPAARAFASARALAPAGALVEDALAREVEAWSRGGELARAHELAEAYLRAFPQGARAGAVRRFGGLD